VTALDLYVCERCGKGAILIEDLKLPEKVQSVKVISGSQVLSLFVSTAQANGQCPYCGCFIDIEKKPEPVRKEEPSPP